MLQPHPLKTNSIEYVVQGFLAGVDAGRLEVASSQNQPDIAAAPSAYAGPHQFRTLS